MSISDVIFNNWKKKNEALGIDKKSRLRRQEDENNSLKQIKEDYTLDKQIPKDVFKRFLKISKSEVLE
jgi:hypothetical protein